MAPSGQRDFRPSTGREESTGTSNFPPFLAANGCRRTLSHNHKKPVNRPVSGFVAQSRWDVIAPASNHVLANPPPSPRRRRGQAQSTLDFLSAVLLYCIMNYSQQDIYSRVAQITVEDPTRTRNQIRHWVNKGLIPASEIRGSGVGTRRSYDLLAVCVGAALVRLSSIGRSGTALAVDAKVMTGVIQRYLKEDEPGPAFFVGLRDGAKSMLLAEMTSEPTVDLLKDVPGEAAWIVDIGGICRLARELA